jgi:thymidine kinase
MAKLYFYYSTMNAGKSTSLLQAAHNYAERDMKAVLFTYRPDGAPSGRIESRIGIGSEAIGFSSMTRFDLIVPSIEPDCVLIDEAQFLTREQVRHLAYLVDELDIPVMCYGLRTDFLGELFTGSAALLAWADSLVEQKTICCCGRKATMVVRVATDGAVECEGAQVEIGGNERYVPLCRKHFSRSLASGICVGWKSQD